MPFGLWNAPTTFKWLMELVLSGLNWKICLIYLYDVIVYVVNFMMHWAGLRWSASGSERLFEGQAFKVLPYARTGSISRTLWHTRWGWGRSHENCNCAGLAKTQNCEGCKSLLGAYSLPLWQLPGRFGKERSQTRIGWWLWPSLSCTQDSSVPACGHTVSYQRWTVCPIHGCEWHWKRKKMVQWSSGSLHMPQRPWVLVNSGIVQLTRNCSQLWPPLNSSSIIWPGDISQWWLIKPYLARKFQRARRGGS